MFWPLGPLITSFSPFRGIFLFNACDWLILYQARGEFSILLLFASHAFVSIPFLRINITRIGISSLFSWIRYTLLLPLKGKALGLPEGAEQTLLC